MIIKKQIRKIIEIMELSITNFPVHPKRCRGNQDKQTELRRFWEDFAEWGREDLTPIAKRVDACLKCGETGHKAKDCKTASQCTKCGAEGHWAKQILYPYFRREVEKLRKQRLQVLVGRGAKGRMKKKDGP